MSTNTQAIFPLGATMAAHPLIPKRSFRRREGPLTTGNMRAEDRRERADNVRLLEQKTLNLGRQEVFALPAFVKPADDSDADSAVIQIWEGTVLTVNHESETFSAQLRATMGAVPEHRGEIGFYYVAEQDKDLIKEGAVFYLTLYNRRKRGGTIENSQELRFRRLPAWSKAQISKVDEIVTQLLNNFHSSPIAE